MKPKAYTSVSYTRNYRLYKKGNSVMLFHVGMLVDSSSAKIFMRVAPPTLNKTYSVLSVCFLHLSSNTIKLAIICSTYK